MRVATACVLVAAAGCSGEELVVDDVAVRAAPAEAAAVAGELSVGQKVSASRTSLFGADAGWRKVVVDGRAGFVPAEALAKTALSAQPMTVIASSTPLLRGPRGGRRALKRMLCGDGVTIARQHVVDGLALVVEGDTVVGRVAIADLAEGAPAREPLFKATLDALRARDLDLALARSIATLRLPPPVHVGAGEIAASILRDRDWEMAERIARGLPRRTWPVVPPRQPPSAGSTAFVAASALKVRAGPSSDTSMLRALPIGTAVDVVRIEGDWAFIDVTLFEGLGASRTSGFVAVAFLDAVEPVAEAVKARAEEALAAGKLDDAVALFQRARALGLDVDDALLDVALRAERYDAAIDALRGPRFQSAAPGVDVQLTVYWGCRGDAAIAEELAPSALRDATLPENACIKAPDVARPCVRGSACSDVDDPLRARRLRELRSQFPAPMVLARIRNRSAVPLEDMWRIVRTSVTWSEAGGDFPGALSSEKVDVTPLALGPIMPKETRGTWWRLPDDVDARVGLAWGDGDIPNTIQRELDHIRAAISCYSGGDDGACAREKSLEKPPPGPPALWEIDFIGPVCHEACE